MTGAARDALVAEYAAKSAVNLSRLLIAAEPTIRRSLTLVFALVGGPRQIPAWAYADRILGAFNDQDGADSFAALAGVDPKLGKNLGFKGGGFELTIVDEDSKINFNVAARGDAFSQTRLAAQVTGLIGPPQYSPMFEGRDADEQYSVVIATASAKRNASLAVYEARRHLFPGALPASLIAFRWLSGMWRKTSRRAADPCRRRVPAVPHDAEHIAHSGRSATVSCFPHTKR